MLLEKVYKTEWPCISLMTWSLMTREDYVHPSYITLCALSLPEQSLSSFN